MFSEVSTQLGPLQIMETDITLNNLLIFNRMKVQKSYSEEGLFHPYQKPCKTSFKQSSQAATIVWLSSRLPPTRASLELDNFTLQAVVLTNTATEVPKDVVSEMNLRNLDTSGLHPNFLMG